MIVGTGQQAPSWELACQAYADERIAAFKAIDRENGRVLPDDDPAYDREAMLQRVRQAMAPRASSP